MKNIRLLKRWFKMLTGKSSFHVQQGCGKYYKKGEIEGYYNDLTNKVSEKTILDKNGIPINTTITNLEVYFPISIFQYGLGLYDLFLETKDESYKNKFLNIADWAVNNMDENGMWDCMGKLKDTAHQTQSAMCQSEGVSVLLRAYIQTQDNQYFNCATKAMSFMIKDVNDGGTAFYEDNNIIFQEYVSNYNLSVLNGWIFSIFGLYDYVIITKKKEYELILRNTIECLSKKLKKYDRKYWSNYDSVGTIASPAYHDIHIQQLYILYDLFGNEEFKYYSKKWKKYQQKKIFKIVAIIIKLKQKLFRNNYYDINTSLVK